MDELPSENNQMTDIPNELHISEQVHITLLSLRQMPSRLQESVKSGATSFSFDEARSNLERLFALAQASSRPELVSSVESFQDNYNGYIEIINRAIDGVATLDEVNSYHRENIILAFETEIQPLCMG